MKKISLIRYKSEDLITKYTLDDSDDNVIIKDIKKFQPAQIKQIKQDIRYLQISNIISDFSYCNRKKVGCIIVNNNQIISQGYNGTLPGMPNICENEQGETLDIVMHAEQNAIAKLAKNGIACDNATAYVNLSPCLSCIKLIISSGINRIVYSRLHSSHDSLYLQYLNKIELVHYNLSNKYIDEILNLY